MARTHLLFPERLPALVGATRLASCKLRGDPELQCLAPFGGGQKGYRAACFFVLGFGQDTQSGGCFDSFVERLQTTS